MLTRYWFRFDQTINQPHPMGTLAGCGVTACSREEALQMLAERVFRSDTLPPIKECIEAVDVSQLDENHVRPNMGNPTSPGVWYPLGYQ